MVENEYVKYFDGLRAYSVLAVMLFHTNISFFLLFWTGVPVFFALSGYLITNILLNSRNSVNYFKAFYSRRILRIFPVYYFCLITILIVAHYFTYWNTSDFLYYLFYIQNFKLSYHSWSINFPIFFNHTWSLAVEEQFYIIFPLIVWYLDSKKLKYLCMVLVCIAISTRFIISLIYPGNDIIWANTLSNFDFLAGGALLAIFLFRNELPSLSLLLKRITLISGVLYFALLPLAFHQNPFNPRFRLGDAHGQLFLIFLLPVVLCLILLLKIKKNTLLNAFFGNKVFVFLGKISYGLYLYHFIIFFWIDHFLKVFPYSKNIGLFFIVFVKFFITIGISYISYITIEKTFLNFKRHFVYQLR